MAYQRPLPLGRTRLFNWARDVPHLTPLEACTLAASAGLTPDEWAAHYVADWQGEPITPDEAEALCADIAYALWWAEQELSEREARDNALPPEEDDGYDQPIPAPPWLRKTRTLDTWFL